MFGSVIAASACELSEVAVPEVEPVVIVHSVINVGRRTQFVILERSLSGSSQFRFSAGAVPPAPAGEGTPIEDAVVTLTHHVPGNCGASVLLLERPAAYLDGTGLVPSGTYATNELCPLSAGDTVDLRVETPDGEVILGTTVIPGTRAIDVHSSTGRGAEIPFDRSVDSLVVDVDPVSARALAFELTRDRLRTPNDWANYVTIATDTMSMVFAGDLRNFDNDDEGEAVFKPGQYMEMTVAVVDTNYYDFVRSFSNPLTGRGFINHLEGGVGVFGSVLTSQHHLRVTGEQEDEREGTYRIRGRFGNASVDIVLDVYLEPVRRSGEFSAFVDGTWVGGAVATSADGRFVDPDMAAQFGVDAFEARFTAVSGNTPILYVISGSPARSDRPFEAFVGSYVNYRLVALETMTVERVANVP